MRETVPAALAGERLDRVVSLLTALPRSRVAALIAEGRVKVDGRRGLRAERLAEGQSVQVDEEDLASAQPPDDPPAPEPAVEFEVVYVDRDVIVIDKPAGLVVHPGSGNSSGTLVNGLLSRYPELASVGESHRPGIVHRLDKGTSGLMVVARSERAYAALVDQLRSRAMARRYLALVWGLLASDRGVVDAPIGRSERTPLRQAVSTGGRQARTGYEVRRRWGDPGVSLVECSLETGRMHQIRVHLAAIGHPVVGDADYRGARQGFAEELTRPFLHAWKLGFDHPDGSGRRHFAAELPPILAEILPERVDLPPSM